MNPLNSSPRRWMALAWFAAIALTTSCTDPVAVAREGGETAVAVRAKSHATAGLVPITGITIDTRPWTPGALPTAATAAAVFNALPTGVAGYTSGPVPAANLAATVASIGVNALGLPDTTWGGVRNPGGAHNNVATRYRVSITPTVLTSVTVQFAVDFAGGALYIDGVMQAENWNDPFWFGAWLMDVGVAPANPADPYVPVMVTSDAVLEATATLSAGVMHTIEVIGFENGNDYGNAARIKLVGGAWENVAAPEVAVLLTVARAGSGGGTVSSTPAGINCTTLTCSASVVWGSLVTLTATPDATSQFVGWSIPGCTGPTCVVTVGSAQTVTATFQRVYTGTVTTGAITVETRYWTQSIVNPATVPSVTAAFNSLPNTVAGYTNQPVRVANLTRNGPLFSPPNVAAHQDIATRSVIAMTALGAAEVSFRFDADYGKGAALLVDGGVIASDWSGMGPGAWGLLGTAVLTAGPHVVELVGFEDCCDGGIKGEYNTGAGWTAVADPAPLPNVALVVTGMAGGNVSSLPAGITCGPVCGGSFPMGTQVTLTAAPNPSFVFTGWGGACTGTDACVVRMQAASTVTAAFAANQLTVSKPGTGGGTVTSGPAGIDCGATCAASFPAGTSVTLTAAPDPTSLFGGWNVAGCTGVTCTVPMNGARAVAVTFSRITFPLTVITAGTGSGAITSSPAGITCGSTCAWPFAMGPSVTLTATPSSTSVFSGWSVAGCTGTTCAVPISAATTVTATFTRLTFALTVAKSGTGTGTVTSSPAGINCGSTCVATYGAGTTVTLAATPAGSNGFAGWSGACTGTGPCLVTMDAIKSVTAQFKSDMTPPVISCVASPDRLWPPNHKMVDITVKVTLTDAGSGAAGFTLLSATSSEPDDAKESSRKDEEDDDVGDGNTVNDIQGWILGTADVKGQFRAERAGGGNGRTYTLTYRGLDVAGNSATTSCKVFVPHDNDDHHDSGNR